MLGGRPEAVVRAEGLEPSRPCGQRISGLEATFPVVTCRGDEARHSGGPDQRELKAMRPKPRDMYEPDLHIDSLKVQVRNFR
jgi:hypothetical protein